MSLAEWSLYLSLVAASTLSPGPAVLLAMSNGATRGWRASVYSSLGNITGLALLSLATFLGVGAILAASPFAYATLQIVGAAYLIYLGVRKWLAAAESMVSVSVPHAASGGFHLFLQGVLVAVSNPKAILFLGALLPQFIVPGRPLLPQFAILAAVLFLFSFAALMGYALLAQLGRQKERSARRAIILNRAIAVIFIVLGLFMAGVAIPGV